MKEKHAVLSSGNTYRYTVFWLKELIAADCLLNFAKEPFTVASLHPNLLPRIFTMDKLAAAYRQGLEGEKYPHNEY
jgi:hypothetical protein